MMLGKTAGGLFWMFRNLERSENTARLVDAGFRMALTRQGESEDEWLSVLATAGARNLFFEHYETADQASAINFLLRDKANPSSVANLVDSARNNARMVRTALTREVWETTNETWIALKELLARPVRERDLPEVLGIIRQHSALVRGALHGTMLRNDIYDFCRLGTFLERADNTARILDVKYYVLLPSVSLVGSSLDNVQWESILRSASAHRTFRWLHKGEMSPRSIAAFLLLDRRLPRSMAFCISKIADNLDYLAKDYGFETPSHALALSMQAKMAHVSIDTVFELGLHEYISAHLADVQALGNQIEIDYRFYG